MDMKWMRSRVVAVATAVFFFSAFGLTAAPVLAQTTMGQEGGTFKDTSAFKPPAGAKVAIIEWQDLQCPACAHAFPIVHQAVAHYNIPLEEKDFPLPQHQVLGSLDGAVWARYLQVKVSPKVADEYRGAVFAAQTGITNKDDMIAFTRRFFQSHSLQMPFVADPSGELMKEIQTDKVLGEKVGVNQTPTIIVCSAKEWVHVTDVSLLYQAIDQVMAKAGAAAPAKAASAKATTVKKPAVKTATAH
ncbi:MAG: DsbA family protein [Acidobacteriota bacterium]|nr:DsbA family protein [Acidobacteriota bacterium]